MWAWEWMWFCDSHTHIHLFLLKKSIGDQSGKNSVHGLQVSGNALLSEYGYDLAIAKPSVSCFGNDDQMTNQTEI